MQEECNVSNKEVKGFWMCSGNGKQLENLGDTSWEGILGFSGRLMLRRKEGDIIMSFQS